MAPVPSVYQDLLYKLNAMAGSPHRYAVVQDPNFHDRVMFSDSQTKKKFSLNLTNESADVGRVWLVGSDSGAQNKVIGPRINADYQGQVGPDYNSDVAQIKYNATSSTGTLAGMVYQSFNRAGKVGDPGRIFHTLMSQGDEQLGITPAPDVPRGYRATQNLSLNQISFGITSNGGRANPDEAYAVQQDFMNQQANAFNPNYPRSVIQNDPSSDARPITMQYLNQGGYVPNNHGRLNPIFNKAPNASIQASGFWDLTTKPKQISKSNALASGSDPATPYRLDQNGIPVPLQARPTTNTNAPAYALSNVLMPGESQGRGLERQTYVFDNFAVPGASIAYHNPNDVQAGFWGTESIRSAKVASLNFAKLLAGEQKLELNNYASRTHGGGSPISIFGKLTTGDQSENILVPQGPGIWRAGGGAQMTLPSYVNPVTGKFGTEAQEGYVETVGFRDELQQALPGMPLQFGRVATPAIQFAGVNESSTSAKGQHIKASEMFTGLEQEVSGVRATRFTGELKGNAFLYGYFGGMNYKQMTGLARDWGKTNPLGGKVADYLKQNYAEAARSGRELNVDFNAMATAVGHEGGGGGLGMMVDWFSQTIRSAERGSAANQRNIKRYGAGYASGSVQLGIVHGDQLEHMQESWRRSNAGMSAEEADASFNKTFHMTPKGMDRQGRPLYSGVQQLSQNAMVVNMLQPRRIENVHGPRMTQDWLQAVSRKYPGFAEQIGANVDTFRPQGASQASAAGLLKYAIWQGQRRDSYADNSLPADDSMPSNFREISDETLSGIQSQLAASASETSSPIEKLRGVVDKYFPESKDSSADSLLYNKSLDMFIPNPRAVLNSTFSRLGTEAAGLAKPMVNMLSRLGGIVNDSELSRSQRISQGLEASEQMQERTEGLISGSGNFFKRLLGTNIQSAVSGRTGGALNLANDEAHMDFNMALMTAKQMNFSGRDAIVKAKQIMRSGASYVSARQPMGTGEVESRNLIDEDEYGTTRFESPTAYERVRKNPLARGQIDMPYSWATGEQGDFDRDPISGALGLNRLGNELRTIEDPIVRADVMTAEKIKALEEKIFPNEGMRNMVNANVKQLKDFAEGKDVVGSALAQKGQYKATDVIRRSWETLMNKTLGMGVGYNPRRAIGGAMSATGYSTKEIANVMSSMPGLYQPALDTSLVGREASGVAAASLIARPYFHLGYEKKDAEGNVLPRERLLRITRTGEVERKNTRIETSEGVRILPSKTSPKIDVDMDVLFGSKGKGQQAMLDMSRFVSEGFARGYTLDGKQVGMSQAQYAGFFAAPGESEALAARLGEDTSRWSGVVDSYHRKLYSDVVSGGGTHMQGLEKVFSTPGLMSIFTRSGSKAIKGRNPITGVDQIEGATEVYNLLKSNVSPEFMNMLTTAETSHDVEHKMKGMNLRSLHPRNLRIAAEGMGQDIKGTAMRTLARIMDVSHGVAAPQRKPIRMDDSRTMAARAQATAVPSGETDIVQGILEKMAGGQGLSKSETAYMQSQTQAPQSNLLTSEESQGETSDRLKERGWDKDGKPRSDLGLAAEAIRTKRREQKENPLPKEAVYQASQKYVNMSKAQLQALQAERIPDSIGRQKGKIVDMLARQDVSRLSGVPMSEEPTSPAKPVQEQGPDLIEQKQALHSVPPGTVPTSLGGGGGGNKPPSDVGMWTPDGDPNDPQKPDDGRKVSSNPTNAKVEPRWQNDRQPQHTSFTVEAIHARVMQYQEREPSAVGQMHELLTGMGMPGEQTPGSVRERAQQAFIQNKEGFLSRIPTKLRNQLNSLGALQKQSALALFLAPQVPGLGARAQGIQNDLAAAVDERAKLGQDIQAFASFGTMVGDNKVNNPYAVMDANELASTQEFQGVYGALKPIMGNTRGRGRAAVSRELRQVLAANPQAIEMLNLSKGLTTGENIRNLPGEISQMSDFAKSINKNDPGLLKRGSQVMDVATDEVSKLTDSYKKQAEAAKALREAHEKGLDVDKSRLDIEARKTNAAYRQQLYGVLGQQAQGDVDRLHAKFAATGTLGSEETVQLERAASRADKFRTKQSVAMAESEQIGDEERTGKLGGFARKMFGGFGLMYLRSILGLATSGLGYGQEERAALDQGNVASGAQVFGTRGVMANQKLQLTNAMALAGGNYSALTGAQMFGAQHPWARETESTAISGVSAWGLAEYMGKELGGKGGAWLTKSAVGIGAAIGIGSLFAQGYERAQDQNSLAYRWSRGASGFSLADNIAATVFTSRGPVEDREGGLFGYAPGSQFDKLQANTNFYSAVNQYVTKDKASFNQMKAATGKGNEEVFGALVNTYLNPDIGGDKFAPEAHQRAVAFFGRNQGIQQSVKLEQQLAGDFMNAIGTDQLATAGLTGLGVTPFNQINPGKDMISLAGKATTDMLTKDMTAPEREKFMLGAEFSSKIPGVKRTAEGKYATEQVEKGNTSYMEQLMGRYASLSGTRAGDVYVSQMQAWDAAQAAGVKYAAPSVNKFTPGGRALEMTEAEAATQTAQASAILAQSQMRLSTGQKFMDQSYQFGNYALGDRSRAAIMGAPAGQEWLVGRALSLEPQTMAVAAKRGLNLSGMPGMTTMNGTQIGAQYAAMTDTDLGGNVTGLNWGTSSFRMGNISGGAMASNIWGANYQNNAAFDQKAIQAGVSGYKLPGTMTLPDGRQISSIGGTTGMGLYASQMQRDQQLSQSGIQLQGLQQDITYQHQMWGIEDKQRSLSHQNTMWSFDFQNKQINMNSRQFNEGQGLNQYGTQLQRSWTREDWGQQSMVRNMQWGWKQEDFQEEARFMTGRQRKLADRSMKRETTMHNIEEDQIDKQKGRQEELWKLEDERFKMTKRHYEEGVQFQKEQLKHSREYYLQNKVLEDEKIKLSRAHWEEEMKLQKQSIAVSQQYAKEQHKLNVTMAQLSTATELMHGQMNTLTDDGMERLKQSILDSMPVFMQLADVLDRIADVDTSNAAPISWNTSTNPGGFDPQSAPGGYGYHPLAMGSGETQDYSYIPLSGQNTNTSQVINVHVGNERLGSFVIDHVSKELRVQ